MWTLPNLLSLSRIPLALVFLQENVILRVLAIAFALVTDGLDGYFARRQTKPNPIGPVIDPLMDKFFVFFVLVILLSEQHIETWKICALLCRDFSLLFFGLYLTLKGHLATYRLQSIWCGKITTVLQLLVMMLFTLQVNVPSFVFPFFFLLGILAFVELYFRRKLTRAQAMNS